MRLCWRCRENSFLTQRPSGRSHGGIKNGTHGADRPDEQFVRHICLQSLQSLMVPVCLFANVSHTAWLEVKKKKKGLCDQIYSTQCPRPCHFKCIGRQTLHCHGQQGHCYLIESFIKCILCSLDVVKVEFSPAQLFSD